EKVKKLMKPNLANIFEMRSKTLHNQCKMQNTHCENCASKAVNRLKMAEDLIFCMIPKVGTTTILNHLYYQHGMLKNNKVNKGAHHVGAATKSHVMPRSHFTQEKLMEVMTSEVNSVTPLRILVVRPPLERLHSAYKDKFGGGLPVKYGKLKKWVKTSKGLGPKRQGKYSVSMTQFLTRITKYDNVHWTPYWNQCSPCQVKYDFILHLSEIDDELDYIYDVANIKDHLST
ncbi:unnamed protein product, partial [Meganyctiphanes norvegica]